MDHKELAILPTEVQTFSFNSFCWLRKPNRSFSGAFTTTASLLPEESGDKVPHPCKGCHHNFEKVSKPGPDSARVRRGDGERDQVERKVAGLLAKVGAAHKAEPARIGESGG